MCGGSKGFKRRPSGYNTGTLRCKKKLHKVQASATDFSEAEALRMALSDPIWMTMMMVRGLPLMLNSRGGAVGTEVMCDETEGDVNVATRHHGYATRISKKSSNVSEYNKNRRLEAQFVFEIILSKDFRRHTKSSISGFRVAHEPIKIPSQEYSNKLTLTVGSFS